MTINFDLKKPCKHCPFRKDIAGYIHPERAREIAENAINGGNFPCHKTLDYSDCDEVEDDPRYTNKTQMCAGAMIFADKVQPNGGCAVNQLARIAMRLGMFDPDKLDKTAPVFDTVAEMVEHQSKKVVPNGA